MTRLAQSMIAATLLLSACGGGSTTEPLTPMEKGQAHLDAILVSPIFDPSTAVMPGAGSASYSGEFGIVVTASPNLGALGDAQMTVDFAAGDMNGSVTNFVGFQQDGAGNVILANEVAGTATLDGSFVGSNGHLNVTGDIEGDALAGGMFTDFKGAGAETLVGIGSGDIDGIPIDYFLHVEQN